MDKNKKPAGRGPGPALKDVCGCDYTTNPLDNLKKINFTNAQKRLFDYLTQNPKAWTPEVSRRTAIANVSDVALKANIRLKKAGQNARIICAIHATRNRFGQNIQLGRWRIVSLP